MRLSVIVPIYNTEKYIAECIESILGQNINEIEIICIDDGSTDGSKRILESYAKQNESIVVIDSCNEGVAAARNKGIKQATGDYIMFVDSDDRLKKNCINQLLLQCEEESLDILYFSYMNFYDDTETGSEYKKKYNVNIRKGNYDRSIMSGPQMMKCFVENKDYIMSACVGIMKRSFIENNSVYFEEGIYYEDGPFALLAILTAKKIICINEVCYERRVRRGSIEHSSTTAKHLYSYMKSCIYMYQYIDIYKHKCNDIIEICETVMERRIIALINLYKRLDHDEYNSFKRLCEPHEIVLFESLILRRIQDLEKKDELILKYSNNLQRIKNSYWYKTVRFIALPVLYISRVVKKIRCFFKN